MIFRGGFFSFNRIFALYQVKCRSVSSKCRFAKMKGKKATNNAAEKKENTISTTDNINNSLKCCSYSKLSTEESVKSRRQKRIDKSIGNIDAFTKTTQQMDAKRLKLSLI